MKASIRRLNAYADITRSKHYGETLREVPESEWPSFEGVLMRPIRVWCSRRHTVVHYPDGRLSCSIAQLGEDGRFKDGISWDDLQRLKREAGFGDRWAVEVFPPDEDIVNVANMRHLWLLGDAPPFGWKGGPE